MKGDRKPCARKDCGHSDLKHAPGNGPCIVRGCDCPGYKA